MTATPDPLEALYTAPPADIGPTSPRAELRAAAEVLRRQGGWLNGELGLWFVDTAILHAPDETGRVCERDGDEWPCFDVQAARKVAFVVGYTPATVSGPAA